MCHQPPHHHHHHHAGSAAVNGSTTEEPTIHTAAPPRHKGACERLQRPPHLMANLLRGTVQVPAGAIKLPSCGSQIMYCCSFTWSGTAYLESHQTKDEAVTLPCHQDCGFNPSFTEGMRAENLLPSPLKYA